MGKYREIPKQLPFEKPIADFLATSEPKMVTTGVEPHRRQFESFRLLSFP
jgi:hypothetical protein